MLFPCVFRRTITMPVVRYTRCLSIFGGYGGEKKLQKKTIGLCIGYTGTQYAGLQHNTSDVPAVENIFHQALCDSDTILPSNQDTLHRIKWSRSSRTDKGVHASCLGLSMKLLVDMDEFTPNGQGGATSTILADRINEHLPPDISVFSAGIMKRKFMMRKATNWRHYYYLIPTQGLPATFDRDLFDNALKDLEGTHNFAFFTNTTKAIDRVIQLRDGTERTLYSATRTMYEIKTSESRSECGMEFLRVDIVGQSFLVHQIRRMMGAALLVGCGVLPSEIIGASLRLARRGCNPDDFPMTARLPLAPPQRLVAFGLGFRQSSQSVLHISDKNYVGKFDEHGFWHDDHFKTQPMNSVSCPAGLERMREFERTVIMPQLVELERNPLKFSKQMPEHYCEPFSGWVDYNIKKYKEVWAESPDAKAIFAEAHEDWHSLREIKRTTAMRMAQSEHDIQCSFHRFKEVMLEKDRCKYRKRNNLVLSKKRAMRLGHIQKNLMRDMNAHDLFPQGFASTMILSLGIRPGYIAYHIFLGLLQEMTEGRLPIGKPMQYYLDCLSSKIKMQKYAAAGAALTEVVEHDEIE